MTTLGGRDGTLGVNTKYEQLCYLSSCFLCIISVSFCSIDSGVTRRLDTPLLEGERGVREVLGGVREMLGRC